ncbi:MAG: site-specific integrase [Alphaproteobacteria bacterium]|nr:site-specific integrase [Alphaproteobacteria bacterium]
MDGYSSVREGVRVDRLTALGVGRAKAPGLYPDGLGLYLQIAPGGARSWILRYRHAGRRRDMGLGSLNVVSLAEARRKAAEARKWLDAGRDPIEARKASRAAVAAAKAHSLTFEDAARKCIKDRRDGWRNGKHAAQWLATLEAYAFPTLGKIPATAIDVALVLKVLRPIWSKKTETASRVRGRIETVLDWAKAHGYRDGENPARWRGTLDQVLPRRSAVSAVKHHPALPYVQIGAFMEELRAQEGVAARAMELLILTATRTSETIQAKWDEFNLAAGVWNIPGERTKTKRDHRVPLTQAALNTLKAMGRPAPGAYVFPGGRPGRPPSSNALLARLNRMGRAEITAHGFRSTFRDWAATQTNFPREVSERALAHAVADKTERAYQRDDLLEKRRKLMEVWAKYCGSPAAANTGNVTPLRRKAR